MKKSASLAQRLRELFLNGHWIANTNYQELIQDVTWQQATHQVNTLNTMAALVFHIDYYLAGLIQVFEGGPLEIRDKYSFDMPPVKSGADWERLKQTFLSDAETFSAHVEQMSEEMLEGPFVEEKYGTYLRNIEAVIDHGYYHMGQLSLVRKMVLSEQG